MEKRPLTWLERVGLMAIGGVITFAPQVVPLSPEAILKKVLDVPRELPSIAASPEALLRQVRQVLPELPKIPEIIPSPWVFKPLENLGPSPVHDSATEVETRRGQTDLLPEPAECTDAMNPIEMMKGAFLENLEAQIKQVTALTDAQEMEISDCLWPLDKRRLEKDFVVHDTGREVEYLQAVVDTLAPFVRRKGIRYTVHYFESPEWNACAFIGGHLVVNRGFLESCPNEAVLAAFLSHEIEHVDSRHCLAKLQYALAIRNVVEGGVSMDNLCQLVKSQETGIIKSILGLAETTYNSAQETEADQGGLEILVRAGYSPFPAARMWRDKMNERPRPAQSPRPRPQGLGGLLAGLSDELETVSRAVFRSHPEARLRFCLARSNGLTLLASEPDRRLYIGARNVTERVPFSRQQY